MVKVGRVRSEAQCRVMLPPSRSCLVGMSWDHAPGRFRYLNNTKVVQVMMDAAFSNKEDFCYAFLQHGQCRPSGIENEAACRQHHSLIAEESTNSSPAKPRRSAEEISMTEVPSAWSLMSADSTASNQSCFS